MEHIKRRRQVSLVIVLPIIFTLCLIFFDKLLVYSPSASQSSTQSKEIISFFTKINIKPFIDTHTASFHISMENFRHPDRLQSNLSELSFVSFGNGAATDQVKWEITNKDDYNVLGTLSLISSQIITYPITLHLFLDEELQFTWDSESN